MMPFSYDFGDDCERAKEVPKYAMLGSFGLCTRQVRRFCMVGDSRSTRRDSRFNELAGATQCSMMIR